MCGIFGFVGNPKEEHWAEFHFFLTNLFIQSKRRGAHASGFSALHRDAGGLVTEKRPISSDKFVSRSTRWKALKKFMPNYLIGHTRLSTSGDPKLNRNNHPFNSRRFSLVHNGTITGWQKKVLETGHEENMRSLTDSELFIHLLEEKEDIQDGFQHVVDSLSKESRFALGVLTHSDERRLFLFRNEKSPCSLLAVPHFRSIIFASTDNIISDALVNTYGHIDHVADRLEKYGASMSDFPAFRLTEFGLDGNTPIPMEHYEIDEKKMGFSTPSSGKQTTSITVCDSKTKDEKGSDTLKHLDNCSKETKDRVIATTLTIDETLPVLSSLRTNRMMQNYEMEHFKKWLGRPF